VHPRYYTLLILGITASLANIAGGWIISSRAPVRRAVLNVMVSLGAGFMLAACIVEVIPLSIGMNKLAAIAILAGYLFVQLVEHTVAAHFHFGEETHADKVINPRTAYSGLAGLGLHAFFDGALIAAGLWISAQLGVLMFLAIVLHKIPEGFTAASIVRASGRGRSAGLAATLMISGSTFAGVLVMGLTPGIVYAALPFSAGVTLYVAASDLIPEVNKEHGRLVSFGVFLGVALFFISESLLEVVLPG
jgi:zinc transporter ZupT